MGKFLNQFHSYINCLKAGIKFTKHSHLVKPFSISCKNKNVFLGSRSIIFGCSQIDAKTFGEHSSINIGNNVWISTHFTCIAGEYVDIEDYVMIGPYVSIFGFSHGYYSVDKPFKLQGCIKGKVKIGYGSWIGGNTTILMNVEIGKMCVIGAGSVVTKSIPDYSIAVGNPAKVIKKFDFDKKEWVKV